MSYEPKTQTVPADGPHLDAFGRARVSETTTIFDSKQLHDKDPLRWAEKLTGAGASTHVPARVASELAVTSGTDDASATADGLSGASDVADDGASTSSSDATSTPGPSSEDMDTAVAAVSSGGTGVSSAGGAAAAEEEE